MPLRLQSCNPKIYASLSRPWYELRKLFVCTISSVETYRVYQYKPICSEYDGTGFSKLVQEIFHKIRKKNLAAANHLRRKSKLFDME